MSAYFNSSLFSGSSGSAGSGPFPEPTGPGSGTVDPDFGNWTDADAISAFRQYGDYISNHPTSYQALVDLGNAYLTYYAHVGGNIPGDVQDILDQMGMKNLVQDGLEIGALNSAFAGGGGVQTPEAYADYLQNALSGLNNLNPQEGTDAYDLQQWLQTDISNAPANFEAGGKYFNSLTGRFGMQVGNQGDWYYFDSTDPTGNEQYTLYQGIFSIASGDITNLQGTIGSINHTSMMDMVQQMTAGKSPGLIVQLILAVICQQEPNDLDDINGNNDVMNTQSALNTRFVTSINTSINSIYNWKPDGSGTTDQQSFQILQASMRELLDVTQVNSQFKSLDSSMNGLIQYLKTNSVPFPAGAAKTTATLYDILINGTDDSGNPITAQEGAAALKQGLAPNADATPVSGETEQPNTSELQGFVGSVSAFGTSITSTNSTLTLLTQQLTNIYEQMLKLGADAVDPTNGLGAIIKDINAHLVANSV